jgi:hypothetical protein
MSNVNISQVIHWELKETARIKKTGSGYLIIPIHGEALTSLCTSEATDMNILVHNFVPAFQL